jgi:hypothetical protein
MPTTQRGRRSAPPGSRRQRVAALRPRRHRGSPTRRSASPCRRRPRRPRVPVTSGGNDRNPLPVGRHPHADDSGGNDRNPLPVGRHPHADDPARSPIRTARIAAAKGCRPTPLKPSAHANAGLFGALNLQGHHPLPLHLASFRDDASIRRSSRRANGHRNGGENGPYLPYFFGLVNESLIYPWRRNDGRANAGLARRRWANWWGTGE